jgi:hypothetical protein
MQLYRPERGNPSMKSMDMICQAESRIFSGCRRLGYLAWSGLACWQTGHERTNAWTAAAIPFQTKSYLRRRSVTGIPEWPRMGDAWNSRMIWAIKEQSGGSHIQPFWRIKPSRRENTSSGSEAIAKCCSNSLACASC